MAVRLFEANLRRFLNSTTGPVGIDIDRRAKQVRDLAVQNASGSVIGIETGALLAGITARVEATPNGVRGLVSTDALARNRDGSLRMWRGAPFSYPAFHDSTSGVGLPRSGERPWLTNALKDGFR